MNTEQIEALKEAKAEAQRFVKRADEAIKDLTADEWKVSSRANGAAKRASMDLSNALVKVRGTGA